MVGTMQNLVNEVLQAAIGNHFRDKLQSLAAVDFIQTRQTVQNEAFLLISQKLQEYQIETRGVYIQDVALPEKLVEVLTTREVANQEIETFKKQEAAEMQRIETEKARGTADMQASLAKSEVEVTIKKNQSDARVNEAIGEATYLEKTGIASAAKVRAEGLAKAEAYREQVAALGQTSTAIVNAIDASPAPE